MPTYTDQSFRDDIAADTGVRPSWASEALSHIDADVKQWMVRSHAETAIPLKNSVRGSVHDVSTGELREVTA